MVITVSAECGGTCGEEMSVNMPLSEVVAGGKITIVLKCDKCGNEVFVTMEDTGDQK